MRQQLRKPENWQDFEELCKRLWGEAWNCPETKKNGRSGQNQSGVDVYGFPKGQNGYFGIQCKGKDDYTSSQLTTKEINIEIEKARQFKPALERFYFATTANKDVLIEEYVRIKDVESRQQGRFEIHLFCWEDIVDMIDQHRRTHDWYTKQMKFRSDKSAIVRFIDDSEHLICAPTFYKTYISYVPQGPFQPFVETDYAVIISMPEDYNAIYNKYKEQVLSPQPWQFEFSSTYINHSSLIFGFKIENTGDIAIEDLKLKFTISGDLVAQVVNKQKNHLNVVPYSYNIQLDNKRGFFEPTKKILIPKDYLTSDLICIRPTGDDSERITIDWELLSRDFSTSGQLLIDIEPVLLSREKQFNFYTSLPQDDTLQFDESLQRSFRIENDMRPV